MLCRNQFLRRSFKGAAEVFREYLKYSDAELPALESIFPKGKMCSEETLQFHVDLCQTMADNGHKFIGVKVIPSTYEGIQCLGESTLICVPLFSFHTGKESFDVSKNRVQFVEGSLCFRLLSDSSQWTDNNSLLKNMNCSVAIEAVGTRFPFFPPTVSSLSCDLGGLIGFFKSPDVQLQKVGDENIVNYHFVLHHNGEPVQLGCGKLCHDGNPLTCLREAKKYASQMGIELEKDHIVLCSGGCPRFSAQRGAYSLLWGMHGSATCTLK